MTWLDPWVGVLLALVLAARVGRDAVRQAAAPAPEQSTDSVAAVAARRHVPVPTWLLAALVLLTLGPRVVELLT